MASRSKKASKSYGLKDKARGLTPGANKGGTAGRSPMKHDAKKQAKVMK